MVICIITGGSGLVGTGIRDVLRESRGLYDDFQFVFLDSKDGDLRDQQQTAAIFEKYKPKYCIHLAARVGGLYDNQTNNLDFFNENIDINKNVLEQCRLHKVRKTISCLSTCIFPNDVSYPINETMLHSGIPHHSNIGYSYAKRMVDVQNRLYSEKTGDIYTSVIPTNVYGKNDNYHLQKSHVVPGLIHRMYIAKENNTKDFKVFGTGKPLRQFIHSQDLASIILWALSNYQCIEPIICAPSDEYSIEYVARTIAQKLNYEGRLLFDQSQSDGQLKKTADNARLMSMIPEFKFKSFEDGIQEAVQWFVDNYKSDRVRK